jgi:hypothetical protein
MSLFLLSLVAVTCAVMVAWVFVLAWRDEDVLLTVVLGAVFLSLLIVAILAVRVSL